MNPVVVLDASVGVKWFRVESGRDEALALIRAQAGGELILAVDTLFLYEVVSAASRGGGPEAMARVWSDLESLNLATVPPSADLVAAAATQRRLLGCSPYDAFAPGLASLLGAILVSADERAHGRYPHVRLIQAQ